MNLSARMIENYVDANNYDVTPQLVMNSIGVTPDVTYDVYVQLVDLSKDKAIDGYSPAGRRYIPPTGSNLQVVVRNINNAVQCGPLSMVQTTDPSIWRVTLLGSYQIRGSVSLQFALSTGTKITTFLVQNVINVA